MRCSDLARGNDEERPLHRCGLDHDEDIALQKHCKFHTVATRLDLKGVVDHLENKKAPVFCVLRLCDHVFSMLCSIFEAPELGEHGVIFETKKDRKELQREAEKKWNKFLEDMLDFMNKANEKELVPLEKGRHGALIKSTRVDPNSGDDPDVKLVMPSGPNRIDAILEREVLLKLGKKYLLVPLDLFAYLEGAKSLRVPCDCYFEGYDVSAV